MAKDKNNKDTYDDKPYKAPHEDSYSRAKKKHKPDYSEQRRNKRSE
jgi:hypothetical protein